MLRKHIGEKVKGVFYGSSIEVRDPISRRFEKKPLKPWLVGQTTLLLERGQLRIPHPDISEVISRQMFNYQVIKVSDKTNEPTYSSEDEHALDAMIFALYAFMNEYPDLVNIVEQTKPASRIFIGEHNIIDTLAPILPNSHDIRKITRNELNEPKKRAGASFSTKKKTNGLGWGKRGKGGPQRLGKRF